MPMQFDRLLTEARLATMVAGDDGYGVIEKAALGIKDGRIAWIGPMSEIPGEAREIERLASRWVTPALIDCHTHLVFAGDRSDEFERRLGGESYESISRSGGGIARSVEATRAAGAAELAAGALTRIDALAQEGVGTVEIKSGYGLTRESERTMLRAARGVERASGMRVSATLLAAHAVP
ncbi:MAG: imidazolonepropionase, partial [Maricaulis maris]